MIHQELTIMIRQAPGYAEYKQRMGEKRFDVGSG
jgi:hypothetical protein